MKFCSNCGNQCEDKDQFCTVCGTRFADEATIDSQKLVREEMDNSENKQKTEEESGTNKVRYTGGPLGYIRPEIFWPVAGIIYFFISLYNSSSVIIWGLVIGFLRPPNNAREWKYAIVTIVIVVLLVFI